jgi:hypothetical protein
VLANFNEDTGTAVVASDERRVEYGLDALVQLELQDAITEPCRARDESAIPT